MIVDSIRRLIRRLRWTRGDCAGPTRTVYLLLHGLPKQPNEKWQMCNFLHSVRRSMFPLRNKQLPMLRPLQEGTPPVLS